MLLVVRKEVADVAEPGGAEQGVDHRVGEDVGVGVAGEAAVVLDLDPAEHKPLALHEAVAVVASPDRIANPAAHPSGSSLRLRPSNTQISFTPISPRNSTARAYS